jgi:putative FmdB family regulatory protein
MPIYEYECQKCGRVTEAFQKFSDAPLARCQHCRGRLHKLISNTSFQLKGSGWYVTDYARGDRGGAKGEKAAQPAEGKPEAAEKKAEKKDSDK